MNFVIVRMRIATIYNKKRPREANKDTFLDKCTFFIVNLPICKVFH